MVRILTRLAVANICVLLAAFVVGGLSWLRGGLLDRDSSVYMVHFCLGLSAVVFNLFVNCLVFIHFLVTGRWVKEVASAYGLPDDPLPRLTRQLKRRAYPPALLAMFVPIAAAAAGMANQHGYGTPAAPLHFGLAVLSLLISLWASRVAYRTLCVDADIADQVMKEVERIRAEHGLPPSEEALKALESR